MRWLGLIQQRWLRCVSSCAALDRLHDRGIAINKASVARVGDGGEQQPIDRLPGSWARGGGEGCIKVVLMRTAPGHKRWCS
jgi:hypothetical protein